MGNEEDPLIRELNKSIAKYVNLRRLNQTFSDGFIWLTILASFVLTIVTAAFRDYTVLETNKAFTWTLILSPLPGVFSLMRTSIGFDRKTAWFSEKATRLDTIRRRLAFKVIDNKQAVLEINEVDLDMEGHWGHLMRREPKPPSCPKTDKPNSTEEP
jgi:hypothetical protein